MSNRIKRINFASNGYGLSWVEVDTHSWEIVEACGAGMHLVGRACRLADRGMKLEYRGDTGYVRIDANVEMMG